MNRPAVRLIVFTGLLALAGAVWGVLECSMFTRNLFAALEGPKSNAAFAYPVALTIALLAAWLAARTILQDAWNTARVMGWLFIPFGPAMFSFMIIPGFATLDRFAVWGATMIGIVTGTVVLLTATTVHDRRIRRERPPQDTSDWRQIVAPIGLITAAYLAYLVFLGHGRGSPEIFHMGAFGGFAIPTAWLLSSLTELSLTSWFTGSLVTGGIVGAWMGSFLAECRTEASSIRRQLRFMLVTGAIVAVVSGLMFLAHAFLLMKSYSVGWNGEMLLPTAVTVWGVLGAIFGLMLALAVHILSAREVPVRLRRLRASLGVVVPLTLIAASYPWCVVNSEAGALRILKESARQHDHSVNIGFGSTYGKAGLRQIIVMEEGKFTKYRQQGQYDGAITACDELLNRYPGSAFRSAALFLKADACHHAWRAEEAVRAERLLRKEFPSHRYDWGDLRLMYHLANLMLVGDDETALDAAKRAAQKNPRNSRLAARVLSAERLGRWDEAAEARKELLAWHIKNKPKYPSAESLQAIERARARLKHAESMLAKKAGAPPTTDVSGRVRLNAQPLTGAVVCLIPSDRMDEDDTTISAYSAGMRGGRIGRTDVGGRFAISGLLSGEYAVVLIVDPVLVPKTVIVSAPGVPYRVTGKRVTLPEIRLTAPLPR